MTAERIDKHPLMWDVMARASRANVPFVAVLELTYRCNLRCIHCYIDVVETDEMTFDEWKRVVDQLKAAGTLYLLFTGGEVSTRNDYVDIMKYARARGFFVGLLSNCTHITPAIANEIAGLRPFIVGTSLYGATADTHEAVTKVGGSFDATLQGIKKLSEAGIHPIAQVISMKENLAELSQVEALVSCYGGKAMIRSGGLAPSKTGESYPFRHEAAFDELVSCGALGEHVDLDAPDVGLCKAGKGMCSVSPRGDVFPCIMFPLKLGNLRKNAFENIWRLEPCAELRYLRSMGRSALNACDKCHMRAYCQRCTGSAYVESGRMDGPSASACRQAETRWRLSQAAGV